MAQKHINPIQNREQVIADAEANFTELYGMGGGTVVYVNGSSVATLSFISDPQTQINNKLDTNGDGSNVTVAFTEAGSRTNISTGEKMSVLFGKIKKFFTDLKTVAFTGSYSDLTGTPTIPTVNNGTLTIQKNGSSVGTFTANQSTATTANITVPTQTSDLVNNSGFITSADLPTVNDGTLTIQQNGTTVKTFTANQSGNATANITVPTKTSELNNDSGFITSSALSNPNILINSNFVVNQRNGYFLVNGKTNNVTPYTTLTGTTTAGVIHVNTPIPTIIVASTARRGLQNVTLDMGKSGVSAGSITVTLPVSAASVSQVQCFRVSGGISTQLADATDISVSGTTLTCMTPPTTNEILITYTTASGVTVYVANSSCTSGYISPTSGTRYTADRWYMSAVTNGRITAEVLSSGGIKLTKSGSTVSGFYMLSQRPENYITYAGKTLTLSVGYTGNTGSFRLQANDGVASTNTSAITSASGTATLTFTMNASPTNLRLTIQDQQAANFSVTILWAKLEVGNVTTEYTPPIIAEELPKCQRYFQRIQSANGYAVLFPATANSATSCLFNVPTVVSLRTSPTITKGGTIAYFQYNNGTQTVCTISAISVSALLSNGVYCSATISGATSATMGMIRANNSVNAYIDLDAEI